MQTQNSEEAPVEAHAWPEPRLRALQVEELFRYAGPAAAFSYIGALLTLGVLIEIDDPVRGSVWFAYATLVTVLRFASLIAFRRRQPGSDPAYWARLVILANLLAGMIDSALLVVSASTTPYPLARRAIEAIGSSKVLGVVLNRAQKQVLGGQYEDYYGYYGN